MVQEKRKVYLHAEPTPSSDVLATFEIEYSVQDEAGTHSAKRIVHIGE